MQSKITPVTATLIAANVIIFLLMLIVPSFDEACGDAVLSVSAIKNGRIWTLITSMFLHGGIAHIMCNMVSLMFLGTLCEKAFGKIWFAILYFASGIAGGLAYLIYCLAMSDPSGAVGASGAIFGLFGAYGYMLFRERKHQVLFMQAPSKVMVREYIGLLIINIIFSFAVPGIAAADHIGGLLVGFVISAIYYHIITKKHG